MGTPPDWLKEQDRLDNDPALRPTDWKLRFLLLIGLISGIGAVICIVLFFAAFF